MALMVWDLTTPLHLSAINDCFTEIEEKESTIFQVIPKLLICSLLEEGAYVNAEENTEIPPLQKSSSNSCFAQ